MASPRRVEPETTPGGKPTNAWSAAIARSPLPPAPAVVVRVWPPSVTVTVAPSAALVDPVMVGVVSEVAVALPPAIVTVGAGAVVNRMLLLARVTASKDSALPISWALSPTVIAPAARTVPAKAELAPSPTAPWTCHTTYEGCAPLTSCTVLPAWRAVVALPLVALPVPPPPPLQKAWAPPPVRTLPASAAAMTLLLLRLMRRVLPWLCVPAGVQPGVPLSLTTGTSSVRDAHLKDPDEERHKGPVTGWSGTPPRPPRQTWSLGLVPRRTGRPVGTGGRVHEGRP
ncbi:MAG: hypothetical protein JWN08_979 [Frankiales bacterium]|nr:hypothetical protein [Frankiales bacterium]